MISKDNKNQLQDKTPIGFVDLNEHKGLVLAALLECTKNQLLGSIGNEEASKLYNRLKYEDYCIKHGITYEEMDDGDFERAYEEESFQREQDMVNEYDL